MGGWAGISAGKSGIHQTKYMEFKQFSYQFDAGPFVREEELVGDWQVGNCRRMLQWYFYTVQKIFLHPEQILCPTAYYETGDFVFVKGEDVDFGKLKRGDIMYAERIRSKKGDLVEKSEKTFATFDEYLVSLHTALFIGEPGQEILHATSIEGRSCSWSLEKFLFFYRPVAVKRMQE